MGLSRETGVTFSGPWILGGLALATDDSTVRLSVLDEGEEILRAACISHNYLWFYRNAIEVSLMMKQWDRVEHYADALERYTRAESLPWTDCFIAWGRHLAAYGSGKRDDATIQELHRLWDEAERVGLKAALPRLKDALPVNE